MIILQPFQTGDAPVIQGAHPSKGVSDGQLDFRRTRRAEGFSESAQLAYSYVEGGSGHYNYPC